MKLYPKNKAVLKTTISLLLLVIGMALKGDEPRSTIEPSGYQYAPINETDGADQEIHYSTSQTPTPACPGDEPDGDPDYYWDFGPLDGLDNGDGTATIKTDVGGSYAITVYCEQYFTGSPEYPEDTLTSTPDN